MHIDQTTIGAKLFLTALIDETIAVIMSTRLSIIICGVNADTEKTDTSKTPPAIVPSVKNILV